MTVIRDDFEVITAKGATVKRFDTLESAKAHAKANELTFPGCCVIRVTITTTEEKVVAYRPRPRVESLDLPAFPQLRRA